VLVTENYPELGRLTALRFLEWAQSIQVEQYEMLRTCLGREFFYEHPSALIRAPRGFVFLKQMDLSEFFSFSRELARKTEDRRLQSE